MMCADCRVEAAVNQNFDPHALPPRPRPRTAEDARDSVLGPNEVA
jgi:hypothetical protein